MTVLVDSLKKQNEFLQAEVERFANAVDDLAQRLAQVSAQLEAKDQADNSLGAGSEATEAIIPPAAQTA
jgi:chaperonin cofactor prefoldin